MTTILLFLMSAGEFASWAPSSLAHYLPLFSSFRIPSRYTIGVVLLGVATAGWVIQAAGGFGAVSPQVKSLVAIVCVLATFDMLARNSAQLRGAFPDDAPVSTFHALKGPRSLETDYPNNPYQPGSPMFRTLMRGRSFFQCYEGLQLVQTADPTHPLVFSAGAKIFTTDFSPNRVEFTVVNGNEPAAVFLNQNFAEGWTSTAGPVISDPKSGKPMVTLPPGQAGKFAFMFFPPGLIAGIAILLLSVGTSFVVWNRTLGPSPSPHK